MSTGCWCGRSQPKATQNFWKWKNSFGVGCFFFGFFFFCCYSLVFPMLLFLRDEMTLEDGSSPPSRPRTQSFNLGWWLWCYRRTSSLASHLQRAEDVLLRFLPFCVSGFKLEFAQVMPNQGPQLLQPLWGEEYPLGPHPNGWKGVVVFFNRETPLIYPFLS